MRRINLWKTISVLLVAAMLTGCALTGDSNDTARRQRTAQVSESDDTSGDAGSEDADGKKDKGSEKKEPAGEKQDLKDGENPDKPKDDDSQKTDTKDDKEKDDKQKAEDDAEKKKAEEEKKKEEEEKKKKEEAARKEAEEKARKEAEEAARQAAAEEAARQAAAEEAARQAAEAAAAEAARQAAEEAARQAAAAAATSSSDYASQVVDLVNQQRAAAGLGALSTTAELNAAAQARANEIVTLFDHSRPDGSSCFTVFGEYGVAYMAAGENIAAGQTTPESVMNSWMNSSGHRSNILGGNFGHIGVGYVQGGSYGHYWVQLFTN